LLALLEIPPARWRPAFSRSVSPHERISESTLSISYRLASPLGAVKNESRMLVTSRRSTAVSRSRAVLRRRRRASFRWSFRITAVSWISDLFRPEKTGQTFMSELVDEQLLLFRPLLELRHLGGVRRRLFELQFRRMCPMLELCQRLCDLGQPRIIICDRLA
jgi:hypothetical protein